MVRVEWPEVDLVFRMSGKRSDPITLTIKGVEMVDLSPMQKEAVISIHRGGEIRLRGVAAHQFNKFRFTAAKEELEERLGQRPPRRRK
jgi:hypothetical protein